MLQVTKDATRFEQPPDLFVELSFARMSQVVNRKAGYDEIEGANGRERQIEVVTHNVDTNFAFNEQAALAQNVSERLLIHRFNKAIP